MVQSVAPDAADADRRTRNRKIYIRVGWLVASSVVLLLVTKGVDWFLSEHDARVASEADDKVDREGPAFTASVRADTEYTEASLYNAPFTEAEKRQILGPPKDLRPFAKARHARGVYLSDVWNPSMRSAWKGYSQAWVVDLISDRKASLVINGMRAKGVKCTPARANTVIVARGEGDGGYAGMLFDLTRSADVPLLTDSEGGDYGKPFFAHRKIDLGNGATPGGLRVQVTSGTKDCTWKAFEVTYVDADGTHTEDITDNGKPFAVHGIAERPAQMYLYTTEGIRECVPQGRGEMDCAEG